MPHHTLKKGVTPKGPCGKTVWWECCPFFYFLYSQQEWSVPRTESIYMSWALCFLYVNIYYVKWNVICIALLIILCWWVLLEPYYGHPWLSLNLPLWFYLWCFSFLDTNSSKFDQVGACKERLKTYLWKWGWFMRLWIIQGEAVVCLKVHCKGREQRKCWKGQVIHLKVMLNRTEKKRREKGMVVLHCRHPEDRE